MNHHVEESSRFLRFLWGFFVMVAFLALLWGIEYIDQAIAYDLDRWGLVPRNLIGLRGILFSPFLHADYNHLAGNTFGFIVFGGLVMNRSMREFWTVTLICGIIDSIGVWLIGSYGIHIGYSGIIYGYFSYLVALAYFDRNFVSIVRSAALLYLFGGILWGIFPTDAQVSWEGHLFGFLGGYWAASEFWG